MSAAILADPVSEGQRIDSTAGRPRNMFNPLAEERLRVALADRNQNVHGTIRAHRKVPS